MKNIAITLAGCAMALGAQLVSAQGMGMGMGQLSFANIDSDGNGELSSEELAALPFVQSGNISADQLMTNWDTDSSGGVSETEFNNRAMGMGGMGMGG